MGHCYISMHVYSSPDVAVHRTCTSRQQQYPNKPTAVAVVVVRDMQRTASARPSLSISTTLLMRRKALGALLVLTQTRKKPVGTTEEGTWT